jgi:hypothetical protein
MPCAQPAARKAILNAPSVGGDFFSKVKVNLSLSTRKRQYNHFPIDRGHGVEGTLGKCVLFFVFLRTTSFSFPRFKKLRISEQGLYIWMCKLQLQFWPVWVLFFVGPFWVNFLLGRFGLIFCWAVLG